jgi:hypothetical protein
MTLVLERAKAVHGADRGAAVIDWQKPLPESNLPLFPSSLELN